MSVVYVRGSTQVKIVFRRLLQNLFIGVDPQAGARVEAMESMAARCSGARVSITGIEI